MFGFTKKNALDMLSKTKIYLPMLEVRLLELAQIEMLIKTWLKSADVDYDKLENAKAWLILVGIWFSMRYAEQCHEVITDRDAEGVEECFAGLLKQGIPMTSFKMICRDFDAFQHSAEAMRLKASLKSKCGFTDFEAHIKMLAVTISCEIASPTDDNCLSKVDDALYQIFLRARDDYFQEWNRS